MVGCAPLIVSAAFRTSVNQSLNQLFQLGNSGVKSVCGISFGASATVRVAQPCTSPIKLSTQIVVLSLRQVDRVRCF